LTAPGHRILISEAGPTQRRFSPYDILHGDEPVASLSATFKVLTSQCIRAGELCCFASIEQAVGVARSRLEPVSVE